MGVIASSAEANLLDKPGGIFVRRIEQMSEEDKVLMQTVARVIISDTGGHAGRADGPPRRGQRCPCHRCHHTSPTATSRRRRVAVRSRSGPTWSRSTASAGSRSDGREYVITTTPSRRRPAPWVNVLANPWFGTRRQRERRRVHLVRERPRYRLTPWNNDPVSDASGEAFYIRDEESGRFWSPTPLPARAADAVHHAPRVRLQHLRVHGGRHLDRDADVRRDRCAGEVRRHQAAERAPARPRRLVGDRLLRARARHPSAGEPPARRHRGRSEDRRAVRAQRVQQRVRRARRVPRLQRGAAHRHRRPHSSSSAATEVLADPGCHDAGTRSPAASAPGSIRACRCR